MKNVIKKQLKSVLFLGIKGFLTVALGGLAVSAMAQSVDICAGTTYTIASTVPATGAATYQWLANGQLVSGAKAATYTVPANKAVGIYRYIRQAKSADCNEWQSSNEFVVTVFACTFTAGSATGATANFTDPRDGKVYKTVVMPDGKTWFAQNLNYTKDLYYNTVSNMANGHVYTSTSNGVPAIGSYWCPPPTEGVTPAPIVSGDEAACNTYGALYTWETAMMVDGKYVDSTMTSTVWVEPLTSNRFTSGAPGTTAQADLNNARGGTYIKGGGRGICPMGWHIPTDREWATMLDSLSGGAGSFSSAQTSTGWWGANGEGKMLKSSGTFTGTDPGVGSWLDNAQRGTNTSGFGAVPAGYRDLTGVNFDERSLSARYWSSSLHTSGVWRRRFDWSQASVERNVNNRASGLSLRCVKD